MAEPNVGTPAPGGEGQPADTPWYGKEIDADLKGWADNKGFKTPVDALRSYKQAETLLGVPAEQRLTLPKDPKAAGAMDPVFNRLGRPETADKYSFKLEANGADGKPLDHELDAWARKTLHPLGLSQDQAAGVYDQIKGLMKGAIEAETKEADIVLKAGIEGLKKDWGSTYDANVKVATEAIDKLGLSAETVAKLRDLVGHADVAKMFHAIGTKVTEPGFKGGEGGGNNDKPAITREGAQHQKSLLMEDRGFIAKYNAGDSAAREQMLNLNKIIAGA